MAEQEFFYALGRRKTSVATVRLYFKKGKSMLNTKELKDIYPSKVELAQIVEPFIIAEINPEDVMFTAVAKGGGAMSQIGALKHALSRAIVKKYPEKKKALKVAGLITRDPRMVERKKAGLLKARKAEQYSKR
jgi:small subunit ribosomal protein S9